MRSQTVRLRLGAARARATSTIQVGINVELVLVHVAVTKQLVPLTKFVVLRVRRCTGSDSESVSEPELETRTVVVVAIVSIFDCPSLRRLSDSRTQRPTLGGQISQKMTAKSPFLHSNVAERRLRRACLHGPFRVLPAGGASGGTPGPA